LHSTSPLGGSRRIIAFPFGAEKTGMIGLSDGEKRLTICLPVLTECPNVTDRQTDRQTHEHRMTAKAALDASIARLKRYAPHIWLVQILLIFAVNTLRR